ncbi:methyltransferase [Bacillus sp. BGMRC 2118]|nr:methyltransferase [Bacillus sp. BGMRC 2118]
MIIILVFIFAVISATSILYMSFRNGITPTPTSPKVVKELLLHLPVQSPKAIAELGAGFGTLAFSVAKKYPYTPVIAYENSLFPWLYMKLRLYLFPIGNVKVMYKDFFQEDLSKFDCIICYLHRESMIKLQQKFSDELTKGTSIYTHTFSIPNWTEKETWQASDLYRATIFHYVKE